MLQVDVRDTFEEKLIVVGETVDNVAKRFNVTPMFVMRTRFFKRYEFIKRDPEAAVKVETTRMPENWISEWDKVRRWFNKRGEKDGN